MAESKYLVSEFNLVGKLIDFIIKDDNKIKYLKIDSADRELWIKLSKQLRNNLGYEIKPGSWLELKGIQKTYPGVGKVKFKADLVKPINKVVVEANGHASYGRATLTPVRESGIGSRESGVENRELKIEKVCLDRIQRSEGCAVERSKTKTKVLICGKSSCWRKGGKEVCQILEASLRERGLEGQITIQTTGCLKQCKQAPNLVMMPSKKRYSEVKPKQALSLLEKFV
jgi:(2Fe-2S) ferredoxin